MKKIVSLLAALSLTLAVWGQNTLDRPLTAFPTEKATHLKCQDAWKLLSDGGANQRQPHLRQRRFGVCR